MTALGRRQQTGHTLGVLLKAANAASAQPEYPERAQVAQLRDSWAEELTRTLVAGAKPGGRGTGSRVNPDDRYDHASGLRPDVGFKLGVEG